MKFPRAACIRALGYPRKADPGMVIWLRARFKELPRDTLDRMRRIFNVARGGEVNLRTVLFPGRLEVDDD